MERITLAPGAHINVLPAEKFNRCRISINFIWPAARRKGNAFHLIRPFLFKYPPFRRWGVPRGPARACLCHSVRPRYSSRHTPWAVIFCASSTPT